ncbi:hypothetical protein LPB140_05870 [Sphingorhabdus lutea]|uniref:Uncharacterized protein n=2 Tax=Sphingorhabdus lutea TaxID=1913578 RepID=A0A1L3JB95_9SPHN|nr:hypothetical protein LPB140_05870 [Sphingorhabdus lutea]
MATSLVAAPAHAMNWCSLLKIIPQQESDFDRLVSSAEGVTGCEVRKNDGEGYASWLCADDPNTDDVNELLLFSYERIPGVGINMSIITEGAFNLDKFRQCGMKDLQDGVKFMPGNITYRDQLYMGHNGPSFTLISMGGTSLIFYTKSQADVAENLYSYSQGFFKIESENSPSTEVKLAGLSPIDNNVFDIVDAYKKRGARILTKNSEIPMLPEWTLSPPTDLEGVKEIKIDGVEQHLHKAEYIFETTSDYERHVALLDAAYGVSERYDADGCTKNNWVSGRIQMVGKHCKGDSGTLLFSNSVAFEQADQYLAGKNS